MIGRALERAGKAAADATGRGDVDAAPAPLPAERHAARTAHGLAGRGGTAEVLLFTSLSVPAASWRQWARDAARTGTPLVLRGVGAGGLRATVKAVGDRLGGHDAGVAIDPRLFRLFGVTRVPAVVVVPGGRAAVPRAGAVRTIPRRPTTGLPETSALPPRWRPSPPRAAPGAMRPGAISNC